MALELNEGDYPLQQETSNKTIFQLKLTDSALRAIEVFQDEFRGRRVKPTIQFNSNQGNIRIPARDGNEIQTYTFLLSSNNSIATHCLQQYPSRESTGKMAVLGEIQRKITVNANDDSYSTTRKRMEIAKELEKNTSTKVIKQPSSSKLGKKSKLLRRKVLEPSSYGRTSTPPPGRSSHSFSRSASPLTSTSMRSVSPVSGGDQAGVRNKTKPVLSSLSSTSSNSSQVANGAGKPLPLVAKRTCERVLHYVALKPIRLQELTAKLSRGNNHPDKTKLQAILQKIATVRVIRPGVSEYSLKPSLYNDVQADWPGYSEDERAAVRRVQSELVRGGDGKKRSMVSPDSTPKNSPNSSAAHKALQEESYSNPVKKKARVSLYSKTSPNTTRPRSVSPLESATLLDSSSLSTSILSSSSIVDLHDADISGLGLSQDSSSRKSSPKRPSSANSRMSKSHHSPSNRPSPQPPQKPPPLSDSFTPSSSSLSTVNPKASLKLSPHRSNKLNSKHRSSSSRQKKDKVAVDSYISQDSDEMELSDDNILTDMSTQDSSQSTKASSSDEFVRKYTPIREAKKRDEYKSDFYAEYKEYRQLHQKVAAQSKRFSQWQKELSQQPKDTKKYKDIAKQVYREYQKLKQDNEFARERDRMQYLHRKLKHIKELVLEFDCKQFKEKSSSRREKDSENHQDLSNLHRRPNEVARKRPLLTA